MRKNCRLIGLLITILSYMSVSCMGSGNVNQGREWQRVSPDSTPPAASELSQRAESMKSDILKAFAQGMRDDAYKLQLKGNFDEAIKKYRKSLAYWPDLELEKYIQQVEKKAGPSLTGNQPANALPPASIANTVIATIRNRSGKSVYIFTQGKTFTPDNLFRPGEIRFVPVQIHPDGKITFYAGFDGIIADSVIWNGDPRNPGKIPSVIFDDQSALKKLAVMTGWR